MPRRQKEPVVIEAFEEALGLDEEEPDEHVSLPERDYEDLVDLIDAHNPYLVIAAVAQIALDQGWMPEAVAMRITRKAAEDQQDAWQAEDERRHDR